VVSICIVRAVAVVKCESVDRTGLTDILYQSDRESITRRAARNEIEVPLRLHIGIFRPAGGGVQAERSEFIDRAWTPLSVGLMDTGAGEGRLNECSG
jgi:hypothetical protein